ncbi:MAG TPA: thioredoxin family protein [Candidatus Saccharimonadaceae bacterium]|nr:thioredoxin family protein [Candidatus Saccharimonadaceae bacterium]
MKKVIFILLGVALLVGGLVAAIQLSPSPMSSQGPEPQTVQPESTNESLSEDDQPATPDTPTAAEPATGRYVDYEEASIAAEGYDETILFFHASWCPECRAFEQEILANQIPEGVQVLKVDYDSSTDLRQRYGVTIQTTFVKVDDNGERISSWVGYGRDKSLNAVLENT